MKGWYGNRQKHSLASRGIKSVENMQDDIVDYDYRHLGTVYWKEFEIDDVNTMEEAIALVLDYEYFERKKKLEEEEMKFVNDNINSFNRMNKEMKKRFLEDNDMTEKEYLKITREYFEIEKRALYGVIYNSPRGLLIGDDSYEDGKNSVFHVELNTDYINHKINKYIIEWRGY